jgi:group I intron endonuclease
MQVELNFCVYQVTNLINNKIYIGETDDLKRRKRDHFNSSYNKNSKDYNYYFHNSIRKYGIENFRWIILGNFKSKDEALDWEEIWIEYYKTYKKNIGYNVLHNSKHGTFGYKWNKEQRNKFSLSYDYVKKFIKSKGGNLLSKEYDSREKILIDCGKGHQWKTKFSKIKNCNQWCPYCIKKAKHTIEDVHKYTENKGGKCLSTEYINCKTKLPFRCKKGHEWDSTFDSMINQGCWCPICFKQRKFYELLENLNIFLEKDNIIPRKNKKDKKELSLYRSLNYLKKRINKLLPEQIEEIKKLEFQYNIKIMS